MIERAGEHDLCGAALAGEFLREFADAVRIRRAERILLSQRSGGRPVDERRPGNDYDAEWMDAGDRCEELGGREGVDPKRTRGLRP